MVYTILILFIFLLFYLTIIHISFLYNQSNAKTIKHKLMDAIMPFSNKENVLGSYIPPDYEDVYMKHIERWLRRKGYDIEVGFNSNIDSDKRYAIYARKNHPSSFDKIIAQIYSSIRLMFFPFLIKR